MALEIEKAIEKTHVRVTTDKRERAKKIARKLTGLKDQDVPYTAVIDDILEDGLVKLERKLGI